MAVVTVQMVSKATRLVGSLRRGVDGEEAWGPGVPGCSPGGGEEPPPSDGCCPCPDSRCQHPLMGPLPVYRVYRLLSLPEPCRFEVSRELGA